MASNRRRQCKKKNSQTNRAKKHMKPWGRGGECTFHHSERFCALRWCCSWLGQCATVPRPHLGCRCLHHLHHLFHSPAVLHGSVSEAPLCYAGSWWSHIAQTLNTSYDYTFTARKKKKKGSKFENIATALLSPVPSSPHTVVRILFFSHPEAGTFETKGSFRSS